MKVCPFGINDDFLHISTLTSWNLLKTPSNWLWVHFPSTEIEKKKKGIPPSPLRAVQYQWIH